MTVAYPLLLAPQLFPRVWGGYDLLPRKTNEGAAATETKAVPIGEAWEVHDGATVRNGIHAGRTLGDLLEADAASLLGPEFAACNQMPLLIKRLSVNAWLSVQVHPDDAQAARLEKAPRGKEEAWYVLAPRDQEAEFILGLREGVTAADLVAALAEPQRWEGCLRRVCARAGAALQVPPGTVHAIGPGISLYEVQQNCDITFRFYDWGRLGLDGQPRALQPEKALAVTCLDQRPEPRYPTGEQALLFETVHFRTWRHRVRGELPLDTGGRRCQALTVIEGAMEIGSTAATVPMGSGESALIPAALGAYTLRGSGHVLRSETA